MNDTIKWHFETRVEYSESELEIGTIKTQNYQQPLVFVE